MRKTACIGVTRILMCCALLLAYLPPRATADGNTPPRACTSFSVGYADGRGCVFGANLDYGISSGFIFVNKRNTLKAGWDPGTTGEYAMWTSKYGSVTFNLCGYQMVWAGMNEAGLVVSTMSLEETVQELADARPPLNSTVWLQYVLDTCGSVDEAIASSSKVRMAHGVDHYLISDQHGNSAVIEFLRGRVVFHKGQDLPVRALTNDLYQESVRLWRSGKLYPNHWDSLVRFGKAADLLKGFKPSSNVALAADKNELVYYAFYILAAVSQGYTGWSIVFDNRNLQVFFHTKINPHLRRIDFSELDFSGGTAVRMLDINDPSTGDIGLHLAEYSHAACLKFMMNMCRNIERGMTDEEVELNVSRVLRFFEQYPQAHNAGDLRDQEMVLLEKARNFYIK
jgi:penicillin V acylase-like amidase (Ntn superfamily)